MSFVCREISKCSSLLQCQQLKITGIAVQTKNPNPRPKVFIRNSVEPDRLHFEHSAKQSAEHLDYFYTRYQ